MTYRLQQKNTWCIVKGKYWFLLNNCVPYVPDNEYRTRVRTSKVYHYFKIYITTSVFKFLYESYVKHLSCNYWYLTSVITHKCCVGISVYNHLYTKKTPIGRVETLVLSHIPRSCIVYTFPNIRAYRIYNISDPINARLFFNNWFTLLRKRDTQRGGVRR